MNKLVVITGGSKGIGKALVERFASANFDVITCARNENGLTELAQLHNKNYPNSTLHTFQADLSKRKEVDAFIQFINELNQNVDVLINNTGQFIPGQIHEEAEGNIEHMIQTNLYSAYHLTRGLLGDMMARKSGHVFMVCSTASNTAYVNGGSYCVSKFALLGLSKVLREEMKPFNVRVSAILPGATYTASWEGVDLPKERFMKSEDVAEVIYNAYSLSQNAVVEEVILRPMLGDI